VCVVVFDAVLEVLLHDAWQSLFVLYVMC